MKFLDKTGLTYLWEKISNGINAKQNKITYGTDEPTGGVSGDVYLMPISDDSVDKVGDLSTLTTEDQSSVVAAINEVNNRIVYEMVLESATDTIEVTDLDMVADGGEYEFELYHAETATGDLAITFNGLTTGYFQEGTYYDGTLTANGNLTTYTFYRPNMSRIYYGTGGSTVIAFPGIMKGRFTFTNTSNEKVYYELTNKVCINGQQGMVNLCGVQSQTVDNLTSIKFYKYNSVGNFIAGTRLIIKRVN